MWMSPVNKANDQNIRVLQYYIYNTPYILKKKPFKKNKKVLKWRNRVKISDLMQLSKTELLNQFEKSNENIILSRVRAYSNICNMKNTKIKCKIRLIKYNMLDLRKGIKNDNQKT